MVCAQRTRMPVARRRGWREQTQSPHLYKRSAEQKCVSHDATSMLLTTMRELDLLDKTETIIPRGRQRLNSLRVGGLEPPTSGGAGAYLGC